MSAKSQTPRQHLTGRAAYEAARSKAMRKQAGKARRARREHAGRLSQ